MGTNLLLFGLILFLLLFIDRYFRHFLARQVILLGFHLFNSHRVGLAIYAVLFFPGTVLHEMAHLLTALALGLGVGKVKLIPDKVALDEPLGSVEVEANKPFRLSFVGLAPFFFGLASVLSILSFLSLSGQSVSIVDIVSNLTNLNFYFELMLNLFSNLTDPFNLLLVYIAASISNHMYPSKADLKYWPFQIITMIFFIATLYVLNYFSWFGFDPVRLVTKTLPILYIIFVFTISLNIGLGSFFWLINQALRQVKGQPN